MTTIFNSRRNSQKPAIKIALVAIVCALAINGVLVIIIHKLQQTDTKNSKKYRLQEVSMTKLNPQLLKLREPEVRKPKKRKRPKPKLIKKRVIREKPPPITPAKMQPLALSMSMRLLPMPQLTAIKVPDKVVEEPVEIPEAPEQDPEIYELDMVDKPPEAIVKNAPIYPMAAKRLGVEGWVEVQFIINEEGKLINVEILNSSSRRFHRSVISAVNNWLFKPAIKNNRKVKVRRIQKLTFVFE